MNGQNTTGDRLAVILTGMVREVDRLAGVLAECEYDGDRHRIGTGIRSTADDLDRVRRDLTAMTVRLGME